MRKGVVISLAAAVVAVLVWDQVQLAQLRHLVANQAADLADSRDQSAALAGFLKKQDSARESVNRKMQELAAGKETGADQLKRVSAAAALWRADERRVILARYSEILDRSNLSSTDMAKLKD